MTMVWSLLWPKIRVMLNAPRSGTQGWARLLVFVGFGALVWAGTFAGVDWFLARCMAVEPVGELLVGKLLDLALLVMMSILTFSHIITSFSTLFLAEDLPIVMVRPVPPYAFYSARLIETCVLSSWMPVLFGFPVFLSAGLLFQAPWFFYPAVLCVFLCMSVIAGGLATLFTTLLTNVMPAQRTRDVMVFLGVVVMALVFVMMRAINPEQLLGDQEFSNTMELFASLEKPGMPFLPSTWGWGVLGSVLFGDEVPLRDLAGLGSTAAASFFVGAWVFRGGHFSGYSKALEGRHEGTGLERALRWAQKSAARRGSSTLKKLKEGQGELSIFAEMVRKDARVFLRDTAQWSQILLILALVVIYLLNFRYFKTLGEGGILGPLALFVMNIGLCGFVVSSVGVRFLFPAISLEGKSFWILQAAPQRMSTILWAKWTAGVIPLLVLGEFLVLVSNIMIGAPWTLSVLGAVAMGITSAGIAGLAVGLGAAFPRFEVNNAARIASGFGGVLYMFLSVVLVVISAASVWGPGFALVASPDEAGPSWIAVLGGGSLILVPLLSGWKAMREGSKRLTSS